MKFPYGEISPELPQDFVPPEMWPEYGDICDPPVICAREQLYEMPGEGIRWSFWPLCFEQYVGDDEPNLKAAATRGTLTRNRIAMWHRLRRADVPRGWHQTSTRPFRVDGMQEIRSDDYAERWSKKARRDLRRWKELAEQYVIETISLDEYTDAYKKSLTARHTDLDRLEQLRRRFAAGLGAHTELWGVRSAAGDIVGGSALIFSPTYKHSTHLSPFISEEGRHAYAATALMDHWFAETRRREYPFVVTTNFWFPGQPRGWKGFSEFKSHFGFSFIAQPPILWKFIPGKLF